MDKVKNPFSSKRSTSCITGGTDRNDSSLSERPGETPLMATSSDAQSPKAIPVEEHFEMRTEDLASAIQLPPYVDKREWMLTQGMT